MQTKVVLQHYEQVQYNHYCNVPVEPITLLDNVSSYHLTRDDFVVPL